MGLPVGSFRAGVLDRVAAVDHHAVADVDAHVACARGVVGSLKKDQVARFQQSKLVLGEAPPQTYG